MTAILARFEHEEALVNAIGQLRARDFRVLDAFTPYEVTGLGALLGASPFRVRVAMLVGGLGTAAAGRASGGCVSRFARTGGGVDGAGAGVGGGRTGVVAGLLAVSAACVGCAGAGRPGSVLAV